MAGKYEPLVSELINGVVGSASRLKLNIESVIEKYNKDFPNDDLIDLYSMEIVGSGECDAGGIKRMKPRTFGASKLKSTKRKETLLKSRMNLDRIDFNPNVSMAVARECESVLKPSCELPQEPSDAETLSSHDEDEEEDDEDDSFFEYEKVEEEKEKKELSACDNDREENEVDETDEFYSNMEDEKYDADEEDFKSDVEFVRTNLRPGGLFKENDQIHHQESHIWTRKNAENVMVSSFTDTCEAKKSFVDSESQIEEASPEDSFVSISSPRPRNQSILKSHPLSMSKTGKRTDETIILSKNHHSLHVDNNNTYVFERPPTQHITTNRNSFPFHSQSPQKKARLLPSNLIKRQDKLEKKTRSEQDSPFTIDISYSSLYSNKNKNKRNNPTTVVKSTIEEEDGFHKFTSPGRDKLVKNLNETFEATRKANYCVESIQSDGTDDGFKSPKGVSVKRTSLSLENKRTDCTLSNISPVGISNSKQWSSAAFPSDVSLSLSSVAGESQQFLSEVSVNAENKMGKMSVCFSSDDIDSPFEMPNITVALRDKTLEQEPSIIPVKQHSTLQPGTKEMNVMRDEPARVKGSLLRIPEKLSYINSMVTLSRPVKVSSTELSNNTCSAMKRTAKAQDKIYSSGLGLNQQHCASQTSGYQTDVSSNVISHDVKENVNNLPHNETYSIPEEYGFMKNEFPMKCKRDLEDSLNHSPIESNGVPAEHTHFPEKPLKFNKEKLMMARKRYKPPSCISSSFIQSALCEKSELASRQPNQITAKGGRASYRVNEWMKDLIKNQSSISYHSPSCPPRLSVKCNNSPPQNLVQDPVRGNLPLNVQSQNESDVITETNLCVSNIESSTPQLGRKEDLSNSHSSSAHQTTQTPHCPPFHPISAIENNQHSYAKSIPEKDSCSVAAHVKCSHYNHHHHMHHNTNHHFQCQEPSRSCEERLEEEVPAEKVMVPSDFSYCMRRFKNDKEIDCLQEQSVPDESHCENSSPTVVCRHITYQRPTECVRCKSIHPHPQISKTNRSCHHDKLMFTQPVTNCCHDEHHSKDIQGKKASFTRKNRKCDSHHYLENPCKKLKIDSATDGNCEFTTEPSFKRKYSCQECEYHAKNQTCSSSNKFSFYYSGKCRSEVSNAGSGFDYNYGQAQGDNSPKPLTMRAGDSYSSHKCKALGGTECVDNVLRQCDKSSVIPHSSLDNDNSRFQFMNDEEFAQRVSSQIIKNIKKYLNVEMCTETTDKYNEFKLNYHNAGSKTAAVESSTRQPTWKAKDHGCCMFPEEYIHMFSPTNPHRIDSDESSQREHQLSSIDFKQCLKSFRPRRHQKIKHSPDLDVKAKCAKESENLNVSKSAVKDDDVYFSSTIPKKDSFHFKMPVKRAPQKKIQPPSSLSVLNSPERSGIGNSGDHTLLRIEGPCFKTFPLRASTPIPCHKVSSNVYLDTSMSTIVPPSGYDSMENADKCENIVDEASDDDQDHDISLIEM